MPIFIVALFVVFTEHLDIVEQYGNRYAMLTSDFRSVTYVCILHFYLRFYEGKQKTAFEGRFSAYLAIYIVTAYYATLNTFIFKIASLDTILLAV
jgi:hypothetical protein